MNQNSGSFSELERLVGLALDQPPGQRLAVLRKGGSIDDIPGECRAYYCGLVAYIALASVRPVQEIIDEYCESALSWRDEVRAIVVQVALKKVAGLPRAEQVQKLQADLRGDRSLLDEAIKELPQEDHRTWANPKPGDIIKGQYRLDKKKASGGFGAVWLATDLLSANGPVAVKFILPDRVNDNLLQRFNLECEALRDIRHPDVVKYIAHDKDNKIGGPFLVTEWIDGVTIDNYVASHKLGVPDIVHLVRECAYALQAIHYGRLIHRDIKPGTIMITEQGRPKIVDLGICRSLDRDTRDALTSTGQNPGTTFYKAPEQREGLPPDSRADVFALGTVLCALLAGSIESIQPQPAEALRVRGFDRRLCSICARAITEDRNYRYLSANDFARELSHWLTSNKPSSRFVPVPDTPYPEAAFNAKQFARARRQRNGLMILLVLIVGVSVWLWYLSEQLAHSRDQEGKARSDAQMKQQQAVQAVSLLLRSIERLDPYVRMNEGGGELAKQELTEYRKLLDTYSALSSAQRKSILAAIASTAFSVGDYKVSESIFRQFLKEELALGSTPRSDLAFGYHGVGRTQHMLGQRTEAIASLESAIKLYGQLQPASERHLILSRAVLARTLLDDGQTERAREVLSGDLQRLPRTVPILDWNIVRYAAEFELVAITGARLARLDHAEDPEALVEAASYLNGASDLGTLRSFYNRAIQLFDTEQNADAEQLVRFVATAFESVLGGANGETARAFSLLSGTIRKQGRVDEAVCAAEMAVCIADRTQPPDDEAKANARKFRGAAFIAIGNHMLKNASQDDMDDARRGAHEEYQRAVNDLTHLTGWLEGAKQTGTAEYCDALQSLALALHKSGQYPAADSKYREAMEAEQALANWSGFDKGLPPKQVRSTAFMWAKHMCEAEPKRSDEAVKLLQPFAESAINHPEWSDKVRLVRQYAEALEQSGREEAAVPYREWLSVQ